MESRIALGVLGWGLLALMAAAGSAGGSLSFGSNLTDLCGRTGSVGRPPWAG
jgi:hypothetical protein